HVTTPTAQEARLLDDVVRRVETYDTHQLYYDSGDRKQAQSRGTEAVLNALILAGADAERDRREPSAPSRRAFQHLWETQRPAAPSAALVAELRKAQQRDGGWSLGAMPGWTWSRTWRVQPPGTPDAALLAQSDGYATGLVVYTLRSASVGVDDPAVAAGVRWL